MENVNKEAIAEFAKLENLVLDSEESYFVVRDTNYPADDLERNFSSVTGGLSNDSHEAYETIEDAEEDDMHFHESDECEHEYKFHSAYNGFVAVHFYGLGAFELNSETLEDAILEADLYSKENDLACCAEAGDGHFYSNQVLSFHKVREGRYIFELKYV